MELKLIHSDNRGKIHILTGFNTYPEVTLFKTNSGYSRGGCIHNLHDEYICVLEGTVDYTFEDKDRDKIYKIRLNDGETYKIPKGTPHYFYSVTHSTVLEWGCEESEKKQKHVVFRAIVDTINKQKENQK